MWLQTLLIPACAHFHCHFSHFPLFFFPEERIWKSAVSVQMLALCKLKVEQHKYICILRETHYQKKKSSL